uniref:Transmembrane protein n=1 Tax=Globodera pallida TaxID=36090 RepID=A0A183CKR8_GLOPA
MLDMHNFEASMRAVTVGGIVLIGALLFCLIVCLVTMVASLTFSCWWTLGSFFKIGPSGVVEEYGFCSSKQNLLPDVKLGNKCQTKSASSSSSLWRPPMLHRAQQQLNGQPNTQRVLLNDELETVTAMV